MTREQSFIEARLVVMCDRKKDAGIGTLGEKTLHRIVKQMLEPDASRHEVKLCGAVVDILGQDGVIEVQTRDLYRLLPKLRRILPEHRVTVVYPIPATKTVRWIDPKTGECTPARKSPKKAPRATPYASCTVCARFSRTKIYRLCSSFSTWRTTAPSTAGAEIASAARRGQSAYRSPILGRSCW